MNTHEKFAVIGQRIVRKEDIRLTAGRGQYFADMKMPGVLHCVYVRSSHAHAEIVSIDAEAAKRAPGVVAVFTGEDIKDRITPPRIQSSFRISRESFRNTGHSPSDA
jgi:aerobic carbon-monoxide dehydrogenase large subunit